MMRFNLTHFINPNLFFICDLSNPLGINELREQEKSFQPICRKESLNWEFPKKGQIVWFHCRESKKFVRCEVDVIHKKASETLMVLWAIDYGFPLVSNSPEDIVILEDKNAEVLSLIRTCSLDVLPTKLSYNGHHNELKIGLTWHKEATKLFEKCLTDIHAAHFHIKFTDDNISFGDVMIEMTEGESMQSLSEILIKNNLAMEVDPSKFISYYNRGATADMYRWDDNEMTRSILGEVTKTKFGRIGELKTLRDEKVGNPAQRIEDMIKKREFEDFVKSNVKVSEWLGKQCELENDQVSEQNLMENSLSSENLINLDSKCDSDKLKSLEEKNLEKIESQTNKIEGSHDDFSPKMTQKIEKSLETENKSQKFAEAWKFDDKASSTGQLKEFVDCYSSDWEMTEISYQKLSESDESEEEPEKNQRPTLFPSPKPQSTLSAPSAKFMSLQVGKDYEIFVTSFGSCSSFFIQVIDEDDAWDDLTEAIKNLTVVTPLKKFSVGDFCLAQSSEGDLVRAKIIRKSPAGVLCFGVDTAELIFFFNEVEKIFEIPRDLIELMPFQAINCRLADIVASSDYSLTHIIYNKVIKRMVRQKVRVVGESIKKFDNNLWELEDVQSYDVILFEGAADGGNGENINEKLVKLQLVDEQV